MALIKAAVSLLRTAAQAFMADKVPRLGAALAYYSVFSMAPLLLIAVAMAGWVFGHDAAMGHVAHEIEGLIGRKDALAVQDIIQHSRSPATSLLSTITGVLMLIVGASGVIMGLKDALNTIWGVVPRPGQSLWMTVKETLWSLSALLGTGFLLAVSLLTSAALTATSTYFGTILPGGEGFWHAVNLLVSFASFSTLFALMFRYLPDARVAWRDVAIGALLTGAFFEIGKFLLALYIGTAGVGSTFGAAGSLAVVLIWIYYSAQILFFGAEFTKAYTNTYGSGIVPNGNAQLQETSGRQNQTDPGWQGRQTPDRA
ncbi:MAG: YihY/virulence factor BrkB family protein [Candidatus Sericytochromatia bacterium]|nr:YihY/virulence factor BrkB family protein [Candidatus Sericytochromatia bacterium]